MKSSLYDHMQAAVDIVDQSTHPTNKIAATIAGDGFALSRTNYWPDAIAEHIGTDEKIGNSSGTIHAETACLMAASRTKGATVFITDLPCPNCMKNMAEAGISALYIDHKGFDKDYAKRRGHHFQNMAMRICDHAGISVYEIRRKEQKITPVLEIPDNYNPTIEAPLFTTPIEESPNIGLFDALIQEQKTLYGDTPFALTIVKSKDGRYQALSASPHPAPGYTTDTLEEPEGKYSYIMQPVNRLIMGAAKEGYKIMPAYFYSSRVPTSRELVNMIGAELTTLQIGNLNDCRDEWGLKALKQLTELNIIRTT